MLCKYLLILIVIIVGLAGKFQMLNIKKNSSYLFFFYQFLIYISFIFIKISLKTKKQVVEKKKNSTWVIRKILFYIVNSINARKFEKSIIYLQKDFDKIFHLNRENKYFNQIVNGLQKFIVDKHNKSLDKGKFNN